MEFGGHQLGLGCPAQEFSMAVCLAPVRGDCGCQHTKEGTRSPAEVCVSLLVVCHPPDVSVALDGVLDPCAGWISYVEE